MLREYGVMVMIGLIQRVTQASVATEGQIIGQIDQGLLALIGVEKHDDDASARWLLQKMLRYRVFSDPQNRMNLSLIDINGGLLLVPQFTLAASTNKGLRPSFTSAAAPAEAQIIFNALVTEAQQAHNPVASGEFGADMQVQLINDGPVTFWLQSESR